MSEDNEISPKRPCHMQTPEAFRRESVLSSTPRQPKSCAKKLYSDDNKTSFVKIKNIPIPFIELSFITFLERLLRRNDIVNEEDYPSRPPAVKANEPSKSKADKALISKIVLSCTVNKNSATFEIPSKEIAAGLAKLATAKFLRRSLVFEPVVHSEEDDDSLYDMATLNESIDFIDNVDTVEPIDSDVSVDKYVASDCAMDINDNVNVLHYYIYVDNVPEHKQKYLKFAINDLLSDGSCTNEETNCILSVTPVAEEIVKVELINEECAQYLLALKSYVFCDNTINFKIHPPTPVSSKNSVSFHAENEQTNEIYVVNLPKKYNKILLKFAINELLWDASCLERDKNGIVLSTHVSEGVVK